MKPPAKGHTTGKRGHTTGKAPSKRATVRARPALAPTVAANGDGVYRFRSVSIEVSGSDSTHFVEVLAELAGLARQGLSGTVKLPGLRGVVTVEK